MYLHIHKYKMKFIDLRKIQVLVYNKKKSNYDCIEN